MEWWEAFSNPKSRLIVNIPSAPCTCLSRGTGTAPMGSPWWSQTWGRGFRCHCVWATAQPCWTSGWGIRLLLQGPRAYQMGVWMWQGETGTDCSPENLPQESLGKTENWWTWDPSCPEGTPKAVWVLRSGSGQGAQRAPGWDLLPFLPCPLLEGQGHEVLKVWSLITPGQIQAPSLSTGWRWANVNLYFCKMGTLVSTKWAH